MPEVLAHRCIDAMVTKLSQSPPALRERSIPEASPHRQSRLQSPTCITRQLQMLARLGHPDGHQGRLREHDPLALLTSSLGPSNKKPKSEPSDVLRVSSGPCQKKAASQQQAPLLQGCYAWQLWSVTNVSFVRNPVQLTCLHLALCCELRTHTQAHAHTCARACRGQA